MKRLQIFLILLLSVATAFAQFDISQDEALKKAVSFFDNSNGICKVSATVPVESYQLTYTAMADGSPCFYAYNRPDNQGFILVSADSRSSDEILAYSDRGNFNYESLPENVKYIIDAYTNGIARIRLTGETQTKAPISTIRKESSNDLPAYVNPLLEDTEWNQDAPYNNLCPELDGRRSVTGCVATAMAQVMYYYRWPEQGNGSHTYYWGAGRQNLSIDFNHPYDWDVMLPRYSGQIAVDGEEASEAVAVLMRDCGYSCDMAYDPDGSAASMYTALWAMEDYFSYSDKWCFVWMDDTPLSNYKAHIYNDIAQARPIMVGGYSDKGGHAFIFDGYDRNGLVHVNFGWGGTTNGYYSITNTGYDVSPYIFTNIMPNVTGRKVVKAISSKDFMWDEEKQSIVCGLSLSLKWNETNDMHVALALNSETGQNYILPYESKTDVNKIQLDRVSVTLPEDFSDGTYSVRPVYSLNGEEWSDYTFPEGLQKELTMVVSNGTITFSNDGLNLASDVIYVDGLFYRLDGDNASVICRSAKVNYYSGDIIIPETLSYQGRAIIVNGISDKAFQNCDELTSVFIPDGIETIGANAFSGCTNLMTANLPNTITAIKDNAFNGCKSLSSIIIPSSVTSIGKYAFAGCSFTSVEIPVSVRKIGNNAFGSCQNLLDVHVFWEEALKLSSTNTAFFGCPLSDATLHVPAGTADKYKKANVWKNFGNIIDDGPSGIDTVNSVPSSCTRKFIDNGHVVIKTGIHNYTLDGKEMK